MRLRALMVVHDAEKALRWQARAVALWRRQKADAKVTVFDGVIPNPTNGRSRGICGSCRRRKEEIDVL